MTAVFGTRFDRERRRIQPVLDAILAAEERLGSLTEEELKAQTAKFRARLAEQTSALTTELDEVGAAKHACADPEERGRLDQQARELDARAALTARMYGF
jgi:preprotein translocase subunit SecA